jgi:cilia- and flagella-associated protein 43
MRKLRVIMNKHATENNTRLLHLKNYKNYLELINNQLRENRDFSH